MPLCISIGAPGTHECFVIERADSDLMSGLVSENEENAAGSLAENIGGVRDSGLLREISGFRSRLRLGFPKGFAIREIIPAEVVHEEALMAVKRNPDAPFAAGQSEKNGDRPRLRALDGEGEKQA